MIDFPTRGGDKTRVPRTAFVSYRDAGVDIDAGDALVERIAPIARRTRRAEVLAGVGGFGAAFRAPRGMKDPVFVAATDGVGTKLRLAFALDRHETIGIDLVAMNVNDVLTLGAEPLVFLDYFATGRLDVARAETVIRGIAEGCRIAGCALVGGETAEMPASYPAGEYDLAGFVVAAVARSRRIDGRRIRAGDVLLGVASSGLHSNGYSLARRVIEKRKIPLRRRVAELGGSPADVLLEPTRIYVKPVLALLRSIDVHGLAHVTGGGIPGNLPRMLPRGFEARVVRESWPEPRVFDWLRREGPIDEEEMDRTFNRGIGLVVAVAAKDADRALRFLRRKRLETFPIGEIARGSGGVVYR